MLIIKITEHNYNYLQSQSSISHKWYGKAENKIIKVQEQIMQ